MERHMRLSWLEKKHLPASGCSMHSVERKLRKRRKPALRCLQSNLDVLTHVFIDELGNMENWNMNRGPDNLCKTNAGSPERPLFIGLSARLSEG